MVVQMRDRSDTEYGKERVQRYSGWGYDNGLVCKEESMTRTRPSAKCTAGLSVLIGAYSGLKIENWALNSDLPYFGLISAFLCLREGFRARNWALDCR